MSHDPSTPRVALITGTSSGLGRALSVELARRGWTIVGADVDMEGAAETQRQVRMVGGKGDCLALDVRDPDAWSTLADTVFDRWGRCDLLINNAGVAVAGRVGESPLEDWRWCLDIDLYGPIYGCHTLVPRMREQGSGHIVNIASIAAYAMAQQMGAYNVAKAGVVALSETLRAELFDTSIGVTVVCPGFFRTNIARAMRTSERTRGMVVKLVEHSKVDADSVAASIADAVERNAPYVVLPRDAQVIFALRRLLPARATDLIQWMAQRARAKKQQQAET